MVAITSVLLTVALLGLTLSSFVAVKSLFALQTFYFVVVALFLGCTFLGMVIGSFLLAWLSIGWFQILVGVVCLGVAVMFFQIYHPAYGYFPTYTQLPWLLISTLFFIVGLEWAIFGFSRWFILLFSLFFAASVYAGIYLFFRLKNIPNYRPLLPWIPLLLLGVIAIWKIF
ncbi:hypothetical protein [Texcoconibacillus texcoconensis]|uniref:Putative membrane protein YfcA n=1 Tax=Texcoconibacillus texcoconensis TaxID=1095777 RepID=A0A840QP66_9BACI|nr:hypothetical protein [Texcoconibacillus texcoconensis]MBB5173123.1 putative membrane protein YfcA [Texcoconibacillus texcoconensis]